MAAPVSAPPEPLATATSPAVRPGLPPGPTFPTWVQTLLWQFRFVQFATYCRRRYGDFYSLKLPISRNMVAVSDPDAIKVIFSDRGEKGHAGEGNAMLEPLVGKNSLLLLDGAQHGRHRRLIHPPFHGARMQRYVEAIREVTDDTIDTWPVGRPFALIGSMQSLTLKVILRTVFGLEEGAGMDRLASLIRKVLAPAGSPMRILALLRRDFGPLRFWSEFLRDRQELDEALYAEIERRRMVPDLADRDDILSLLLQARDDDGNPMTNVELRDELITLLVAGHETTATALAWFFDLVLHDERVLARLKTDAAAGETAYLDAAIAETLRVRPVVAMVARKLQVDMDLGPYTIPRGSVVAPNIFLTHRRADLYPDPLAFRPERFLDQRPETYTWLPFGGGIRRCVGADFAQMEMREAIPEILRRTDLRAADPRREKVRRSAVTLVPDNGTRVVLEERRPR